MPKYQHKEKPAQLNLVAWVSDHLPLQSQLDWLWDRGFDDVVQVVPPPTRRRLLATRFTGAKEVWDACCNACSHTKPALVVAVLPPIMLGQLAYVAAPTPVWRADMIGPMWLGTWTVIEGLDLRTRPLIEKGGEAAAD